MNAPSFKPLFTDMLHACADPEGGQVVRIPLKNHKNIGFLSNTGPNPQKNHIVPSQHSMLGHHRPASEMADDGPLLVVFWILSPLIKNVVKVGPPSGKTFWILACTR